MARIAAWLLLSCGALFLSTPPCGATTIEFSDVSLSFRSGKKEVRVLTDVFGRASAGRLTAIMGPSGSGKSSLLSALNGQCSGSLSGRLCVDGRACQSGVGEAVRSAYVRQQDLFYAQMTVRETLMFAARLRLGREISNEEKAEVVNALLAKLGLSDCADSLVGDGKKRGISGGEKKRLNIACELIGDPQVIFLDEPTSGLDSFQAERVVEALRTLASEGKTVVCVIHQPSEYVFRLFDDLLLLADGRVAYCGAIAGLRAFLASCGRRMPAKASLAEFAISSVSLDTESPETERSSREAVAQVLAAAEGRLRAGFSAAQGEAGAAGGGLRPREALRPKASLLEQYRLLFARSFREVRRGRLALFIKVMQQLSTALIYGGIYDLDRSQRSIQDRFGLMSLISIGTTNLAVAGTIRQFPKEKAIFREERSKRVYAVLPYFLSKVLADAPVSVLLSSLFGAVLYPLVGFQRSLSKFTRFLAAGAVHALASSSLGLLLGAAAPSSEAALALLPPVVILQAIFNGVNIAAESTPRALRWIPQVSLVRWGFEGQSINEMSGLAFECDRPGPCCKTGEEALDRISIAAADGATFGRALRTEGLILAACYLQTYRLLCKSDSFSPMLAPTPRP